MTQGAQDRVVMVPLAIGDSLIYPKDLGCSGFVVQIMLAMLGNLFLTTGLWVSNIFTPRSDDRYCSSNPILASQGFYVLCTSAKTLACEVVLIL